MQEASSQFRMKVQRRSGDPKSTARRPSGRASLLGQVVTPNVIADEMARILLASSGGRGSLSILDPCVGPGTFPTALAPHLSAGDEIVALDIDPAMVTTAGAALVGDDHALTLDVADYLRWEPSREFDAVIMNPPYLRQEWIDHKSELRSSFAHRFGLDIPGTSNAYVYFIAKALHELRAGGRLVAIVYDSWTFTRYGRWLRRLLEGMTEELELHEVAPQPFAGRLIDATIISAVRSAQSWRPASRPRRSQPEDHPLLRPIDELYDTRRGLRLKQSRFFLCPLEEADAVGATQFVKHVRFVDGYSVSRDHPEAALLVPHGSENHPAMVEARRRLAVARANPERFQSILTWADARPQEWYSHAQPPRAPILFNYYIRGRAKHLANPMLAYADNFYGAIPRHDVPVAACIAALNSSFTLAAIGRRSRTQGNGLSKLQLYEYRGVRAPAVHLLSGSARIALATLGEQLGAGRAPRRALEAIDAVLDEALGLAAPSTTDP